MTVVSPDAHLQFVLATHSRHALGKPLIDPLVGVQAVITRELQGSLALLTRVEPSGSHAKGTAVLGGSDLDLFLSFAAQMGVLSDVYQAVFLFADRSGWRPRRQRVSVGITYAGYEVDLVPARQQPSGFLTGDHSLYVRARDTWTKTNVRTHVTKVRDSGLQDEIRLMKIWRNQRGLELPSFLLELFVIQHLLVRRFLGSPTLASRIHKLFDALAREIQTIRIVDPANASNVLSDDMTFIDKQEIAEAARSSAALARLNEWDRIIKPR